MVTIHNVTLNDMTQSAKLYMSVGTKIGLAQKGQDQMDLTGRVCNKGLANCCISRSLSDGMDTDTSTVFQNSARKQKH